MLATLAFWAFSGVAIASAFMVAAAAWTNEPSMLYVIALIHTWSTSDATASVVGYLPPSRFLLTVPRSMGFLMTMG